MCHHRNWLAQSPLPLSPQSTPTKCCFVCSRWRCFSSCTVWAPLPTSPPSSTALTASWFVGASWRPPWWRWAPCSPWASQCSDVCASSGSLRSPGVFGGGDDWDPKHSPNSSHPSFNDNLIRITIHLANIHRVPTVCQAPSQALRKHQESKQTQVLAFMKIKVHWGGCLLHLHSLPQP